MRCSSTVLERIAFARMCGEIVEEEADGCPSDVCEAIDDISKRGVSSRRMYVQERIFIHAI